MMDRNVKAVVFDLDGTLLDTEKYYCEGWPAAAAHFGLTLDREKTLMMRSLGQPFAKQQFAEWFGEDNPFDEVRAYRRVLVDKIFEERGIELKPGALELLQWLKAHGILTAIATANQVERTERLLRRIGLIEYFDRVIGADLVERGKPAPDTYRYACEVLALPPEQVIAVEDAPNGVLSAHAAGCRVIMVPDQSEPDELLKEKLFAVVPVLTDIIDLIDSPDGSKAEKGSR